MAQDRFLSYRAEEELGRGTFGIVYLGTDPQTGNKVAIKVLQGRTYRLDKAGREFLATQHLLGHKNIAAVLDVFFDEKTIYIVSEYVNNSRRLSQWEPSSILAMAVVFSELADACIYMHSKGIVHSDIKPDNILIKGDLITGEALINPVPVMIDFDSACTPETAELRCEKFIGTPNFIAPEIWGKDCNYPTKSDPDISIDFYKKDVYALGVTFYVVANNGKMPYPGTINIEDLCERIATVPPVPSNSSSSKLDEIIMAMIEKNPAERIDLAGVKVLLDFLIKQL